MSTNNNSQVVVAYDFSESGRAALFRAIAIAKRAPWHVMHFVYALEPHSHIADADRAAEQLRDIVTQELEAADVTDRVHFCIHTRIGKPGKEILDCAREVGADLIIIGTKGLTGVERLVLGSVAEQIVREAGCTVEVARPKTYPYVQLLEVTDATTHHKTRAAHRYSYESKVAQKRPTDWPLY